MNEVEKNVLDQRRSYLEHQLADAKLSVAIYQGMYSKFEKEEDRRAYEQELEKVSRFETALDIVEQMEQAMVK